MATNKGLIKIILIIIIGVIVLSYFGFDLRSIVEAPQTQENFNYVQGFILNIWNNYLRSPVLYFWNNIFIDLLWETFVSNFERLKAGEPTDFELNTPFVETN